MHEEIARQILDANSYMTLATADESGTPWASPVWFAPSEYRELFWISSPDARHSRNIAARPEIAIVIFDSTVAVGDAQAVYMAARAEQVEATQIDVFNRVGEAQGLRAWTHDDVTAPSKHRLYRATVTEASRLGPGDERVPL
jgi:nitroimidazol reductase NimA-like FMN-containing flavoprotein (pyridoxamine 5'-phosphate oxidase superfamily)